MNIQCDCPEKLHELWHEHEERCAFLIGHKSRAGFHIADIWPAANVTRRDAEHAYAIGADTWHDARINAQVHDLSVIGHAHSHPNGTPDPSQLDMRYVRKGELGAVYHPKLNQVTWYNRSGSIHCDKLPPLRNLWKRAITKLLF